jgi:hypothetical protein
MIAYSPKLIHQAPRLRSLTSTLRTISLDASLRSARRRSRLRGGSQPPAEKKQPCHHAHRRTGDWLHRPRASAPAVVDTPSSVHVRPRRAAQQQQALLWLGHARAGQAGKRPGAEAPLTRRRRASAGAARPTPGQQGTVRRRTRTHGGGPAHWVTALSGTPQERGGVRVSGHVLSQAPAPGARPPSWVVTGPTQQPRGPALTLHSDLHPHRKETTCVRCAGAAACSRRRAATLRHIAPPFTQSNALEIAICRSSRTH